MNTEREKRGPIRQALNGTTAFPGSGTPFWKQPVREKDTGRLRQRTKADTVKDAAVIGGASAGVTAAVVGAPWLIAAGALKAKRGGRTISQRFKAAKAVGRNGVVRDPDLAKAVDRLPLAKTATPKKRQLLEMAAKIEATLHEFAEDPRSRNDLGQFSDTAAVTGVSPSTTTAAYGVPATRRTPKDEEKKRKQQAALAAGGLAALAGGASMTKVGRKTGGRLASGLLRGITSAVVR